MPLRVLGVDRDRALVVVEHGEVEAVGLRTSRSWPRVMSPTPGRSTLMTSAPNQASSCVQVGPDCTWVKSRILTPSSALPAWPHGFDDGRGRPLPAAGLPFLATAILAAAFLTILAPALAAFLAVFATPLAPRLTACVLDGALGDLGRAFARCLDRRPPDHTFLRLHTLRHIQIPLQVSGVTRTGPCPAPRLGLLSLLELALRIEIADAAALAAGRRIDAPR